MKDKIAEVIKEKLWLATTEKGYEETSQAILDLIAKELIDEDAISDSLIRLTPKDKDGFYRGTLLINADNIDKVCEAIAKDIKHKLGVK